MGESKSYLTILIKYFPNNVQSITLACLHSIHDERYQCIDSNKNNNNNNNTKTVNFKNKSLNLKCHIVLKSSFSNFNTSRGGDQNTTECSQKNRTNRLSPSSCSPDRLSWTPLAAAAATWCLGLTVQEPVKLSVKLLSLYPWKAVRSLRKR